MKPVIVISGNLFVLLFFSCSHTSRNKFVGTWKNKPIDTIEIKIKKEGEEFMVATISKGKVSSTFSYTSIDSALVPTRQTRMMVPIDDSIHYLASSGRLSWQGIEWEKTN
jgi:hypothetical protein